MSNNTSLSRTLGMQPIISMVEEHGFIPFEPSDNPALHHLATDPAMRNEYMPEDWTGFTEAAQKEFRARVQSPEVNIVSVNGIPIPDNMPLLWMKAHRANQLYTYDKTKDLVYLLSHNPPPQWISIRTKLLTDFACGTYAQTVTQQLTPTSGNGPAAEQGQYMSYQTQEYTQTMFNTTEMPQIIPLAKQNDGVEQGSTMLSDHPQDPFLPASGWIESAQTMPFTRPIIRAEQSDDSPPYFNYFDAFPHRGASPFGYQPQTVPETSEGEKGNHNEGSNIWPLEASETYDEYPEITAAAMKAANN